MKYLVDTMDYNETIKMATNLQGNYNKKVIFHAYWNGDLNEKHFYSILSCYFFNVYDRNHEIILWLENNKPNNINKEISKYCEIKNFSIDNEVKNTFLEDETIKYVGGLTEKANFYRMVLLYNYGGCWFDLDCLFLRNFDPLFKNYENEICLYRWSHQNYPNNAIFISLEPNSLKMKNNINFIIKHDKGWGFQRANLHKRLDMDILILPCSWFDAGWMKTDNTEFESFKRFFEETDKVYNFNNFHKGSFCYHWHNKWKDRIQENCIFIQLIEIIKKQLKIKEFNF
jgi:hypothetical protein